MATVSEQLKGTFSTARMQIEGFEKKAVKQVALLEKKAKESLGDVKGQTRRSADAAARARGPKSSAACVARSTSRRTRICRS